MKNKIGYLLLFMSCLIIGNTFAGVDTPEIKDLFERSKSFYNDSEYAFEVHVEKNGKIFDNSTKITLLKGEGYFFLNRNDRSVLSQDSMTLMINKKASKMLLTKASKNELDFDALQMNFFTSKAFLTHKSRSVKKENGRWVLEWSNFQAYKHIIIELDVKDYHIHSVSYESETSIITAYYNEIEQLSKDLKRKTNMDYYIKKRSGEYVVKDKAYQLLDYRNQSTKSE